MMKKLLMLTVCAFVFCSSSFAKEVKGKNLSFQIAEDTKFDSKDKHEFYTFTWQGKTPISTLFMMYPNPAPASKEMLKPMVDMMLVGFKTQIEKNKGMKLKSSKKREVTYGPFSGYEIEFVVNNEAAPIDVKQYMFILFDGEKCWNAQLTSASQDDIKKAYDILKNAKKISEPTK